MLNIIQCIFLLITFTTVFLGLLIQYFEPYLPSFISQIYRYGKFSYSGSSNFLTVRVPKRWFRHFYVFSSIFSATTLLLILFVYFSGSCPHLILDALDILGGSRRKANVSSICVLLASILMTIQCWKRFYETHYISIFSDAKMDFGHYLLGFIHYFGAIVSIILEAPGFIGDGSKIIFELNEINWRTIFIVISFIMFCYKQYESASILANLRKNDEGRVVTQKYMIPKGGLFEYITSPHLTCEIMMYVCLTSILFGNSTFPFVLFWVLSNQTMVAVLNHEWYKQQFPNYPKHRKVLIPGIF